MNNDIKFLDIEWRTPYPLTNFEDRFGLRASVIFLDSNMYGFLFIWTLARSHCSGQLTELIVHTCIISLE